MSFIDENDEVLVAGFGRSGHAVGDLPGVRFRIVKVAGVSLYALWLRKKEKPIKWVLGSLIVASLILQIRYSLYLLSLLIY